MSSRHHIDDFMRGRIIGKIEEGRKITDVARVFDIAHSVVSRLWKSFKTTGMCSRRHGGGRVRSTTPAQDRYRPISKKEQAHHIKLSRIRVHYEQLSKSERNRIIELKEGGWANRRIARHMDGSDAAVIRCCNELSFQLYPDKHRRRVWRWLGQRANPAFTIERHTGLNKEL
ncbi:uncharacterized protein TNCV_2197551 [Trichonephila clavipes]|nr:uncharacterized protein TNCV_2197551 [Trichonephila clavipes]